MPRASAHFGSIALALAASIALGGSPRRARADTASDALPSPLKPDDVLNYARSHRAEIKAAQAKASAKSQVSKVVSALPDPMVMVGVDHLPFKLMGINASIQIQQDFPFSGVLGKRAGAAEADARAFAADALTVKLDVEYQALASYLMLVELQRVSTILDELIPISKQVVVVTEARLGAAASAAADVVRAQLDVARLEGERETLDAELKGAGAMLQASLGQSVDGKVPVCELTVPIDEPPSVPTLLAKAMEKRPELSAMREREGKADLEIDVMRAMYKPMGFVRVGTAYTMTGGYGAMFMVGVTVPIWREKLDAGVAEAQSMATMAIEDTAAMRKMIEGEVGVAREQVTAARIRLATAREKLLPLAKSALTLTLACYGSGTTPLVAVLDAVSSYREVRMEEAVADIRIAAAWAHLGRTVGVVKVGF